MRISDKPAALINLGVLAVVILLGWVLWQDMYGPPYILVIKPAGEGAVVQLIQRESDEGTLVSPPFEVPAAVTQESQVELTSPEMQIPGGEIEFADNTITPGRFTLRFGEKTIDVMEARIIVDGVSHEWAVQE